MGRYAFAFTNVENFDENGKLVVNGDYITVGNFGYEMSDEESDKFLNYASTAHHLADANGNEVKVSRYELKPGMVYNIEFDGGEYCVCGVTRKDFVRTCKMHRKTGYETWKIRVYYVGDDLDKAMEIYASLDPEKFWSLDILGWDETKAIASTNRSCAA
jgi:hypothetical protein